MAYSNVMRYTGTSGVDTASMVEAMMKVEGLKYDTLYKKNLSYQYKQEAYQSVGNKLIDIQKANLDALAQGSLRKSSTFKSNKSSMTTASGATSSAISVKLGSSSKNFSSKVSVKSLATAESVSFQGKNVGKRTASEDFDLAALRDIKDADGNVIGQNDSANIDVTVDGVTKSITVDLTTVTDAASFASQINDSIDSKFGSGKASFTADGNKLSMNATSGHTMKLTSSTNVSALGFSTNASDLTTAKTSSSTVKDTLGLSAGTFTLEGANGSTKIEVTDDMTVDDFMAQINASSNATMSYSSVSGTYTITGSATGEANSLKLGFDYTDAAQTDVAIGSSTDFFAALGVGATVANAKDAEVTIDGVDLKLESNSYTYDDGTVIKFNSSTVDSKTGIDDPINITASEDTDQTKTAIKAFVDMYNSLLNSIYDQTRTTRPKSGSGGLYNPLTEEESAALSATEVEKWEENAKKGLLYKDQDLKSIETNLRAVVQKSITLKDGSTFRLSDLGIKLDKDYSKGGLLSIDEDKLNEVVGNSVSIDNIAEAFTNTTNGYSTLLNKELNATVGMNGSLTEKVGLKSSPLYMTDNTMKTRITQNTYKLADLKDRLAKKEDRYYEMFSYMENSITNSNNQLSALGLGY